MIKAVIFDFDHTLYDREKTICGTAPELYRLLGDYLRPEVSQTQFAKALMIAETSEKGYYHNGYQGVCDELDRLEVFSTKPTKAQYCELYYPAMSKNIAIFPDAYDTLRLLKEKGYKLALLTNGYTVSQQEKLKYTQVPQYMDEIIISEELGRQKPDPRTFITMCRRLGIRTDEAVYVGDNIICDVCGARGAGLIPIWKPFARQWPDDITPPPYTIDRLSEIPAIIQELNR